MLAALICHHLPGGSTSFLVHNSLSPPVTPDYLLPFQWDITPELLNWTTQRKKKRWNGETVGKTAGVMLTYEQIAFSEICYFEWLKEGQGEKWLRLVMTRFSLFVCVLILIWIIQLDCPVQVSQRTPAVITIESNLYFTCDQRINPPVGKERTREGRWLNYYFTRHPILSDINILSCF